MTTTFDPHYMAVLAKSTAAVSCIFNMRILSKFARGVQNGFQRNRKAEQRAISAYFHALEISNEAVTLYGDVDAGHAIVQSTRDSDVM
jgi:hypothetical protein